eukprot:CAMPEP_0175116286 /NCGR_PEP_ID=MMETSP0086_2-20121207/18094_1 /TAXON_ID=136419 /ORGANISM="Unknown Unknown, Strain D1" /LENGTH=130 /DNA_ID=CAMNT_0016396563 /DNA_START=183 /DNA_END=575 /DNA_ORIENTATION=+
MVTILNGWYWYLTGNSWVWFILAFIYWNYGSRAAKVVTLDASTSTLYVRQQDGKWLTMEKPHFVGGVLDSPPVRGYCSSAADIFRIVGPPALEIRLQKACCRGKVQFTPLNVEEARQLLQQFLDDAVVQA